MASFQILRMTAVKIKNDQVAQLLKENYDDVKTDQIFFLLISSRYMINYLVFKSMLIRWELVAPQMPALFLHPYQQSQ
jgi:hypothetical protein